MATHRFRRGEKILTPIVDQKQADSSYTSGRQGKDCTAGIHQAAGPRLHSNEQDQTHWEACDLREYARIMGTRVILEAKAPEESQEVEYISDSSEPESPLIKHVQRWRPSLQAHRWIGMPPNFRGSSRSTSYHRLTDPKIRILMGKQIAPWSSTQDVDAPLCVLSAYFQLAPFRTYSSS